MSDEYGPALARRFREELMRADIRSENAAAAALGKVQQWLNARQLGHTAWGVSDLHWACERLGLDFMYVVTGQRKSDIAAELLQGVAAIVFTESPAPRRVIGNDARPTGSLKEIFEHYFGAE